MDASRGFDTAGFGQMNAHLRSADIRLFKSCFDNDIQDARRSLKKGLFSKGANINARAEFDYVTITPLTMAIAHSDAALVEFLLSSGATVDDQALKTAIQESRPDAVRLLILAGADINTRDSHGDPILNVLLRKSMPNYRESRVQWNLS